jgi:glycosyltransferase involved in cell wall biosynthesis
VKISYLVCCHNEVRELLDLVEKLNTHIESNSPNDEVVILDDFSDNEDTKKILEKAKNYGFSVVQHALNKNFAEHKNYGSKRCVGDYIVQLDADEYLPRVNIVRGATPQDAAMWGWHLSSIPEHFGNEPIVNWNHGDYQSRIYKNSLKIQWKKPLHETIDGAEYVTMLPKEVEWSIIHDKTIDRQLSQNKFYNQNWSRSANMGHG